MVVEIKDFVIKIILTDGIKVIISIPKNRVYAIVNVQNPLNELNVQFHLCLRSHY